VAYGSDTRRVAELLAEVADRHGLVQKDPKPQVLFVAFGDSTLNFELRYWVNVVKNNAAQIGSDLRHMIATVFSESGIVMAFPQRDIRLASGDPLQVQLLAAHPAASGPGPAKGSGQEDSKGEAASGQKPHQGA
jgi:small-conductance mechanosensitive channel